MPHLGVCEEQVLRLFAFVGVGVWKASDLRCDSGLRRLNVVQLVAEMLRSLLCLRVCDSI